jgi:hypothetical protein
MLLKPLLSVVELVTPLTIQQKGIPVMEEAQPIQVEDIDLTKRTSAFNTPTAGEPEGQYCYFNGRPFSIGAEICYKHTRYKCYPAGWSAQGSC